METLHEALKKRDYRINLGVAFRVFLLSASYTKIWN